jgi:hypothetical protein
LQWRAVKTLFSANNVIFGRLQDMKKMRVFATDTRKQPSKERE